MFATIAAPPQRLLVFTRAPDAGAVPLDSLGSSTEEIEIEVMWEPAATANRETLRRAFGDRALAMQTGTTLGDRLCMAFSERLFFQRTEKIIAIGMDDPGLDRATIDHAFALLDSCDWVLGPSSDGRCYLIGCRGAAFDASIFMDVEWGTDRVMESTLQLIRRWESTLAMLPRQGK
jgi:glycosyltransferase A (GT-A) superfamily protein (DUF2064 family)